MTEPSARTAATAPCPNCGSAHEGERAFCVNCGYRMVVDVTDAAIPTQGAPGAPSQPVLLTRDSGAPEIPAQRPAWPADGAAPEPVWPPAQAAAEPAWPPVAPDAGWVPAQAAPEAAWPPAGAYVDPSYVDPSYVNPGYAQAAYPGLVPFQPSSAEPTQLGVAGGGVRRQAEPSVLPHGWTPASFGQRVAARLIDYLAVSVLAGLLYAGIVGLTAALGVTDVGFGFLIGALLLILFLPTVISTVYRIGSDFGLGRSLGRAAVGIRLVKLPRLSADVAVPPADRLAHVGFGTVLGRLIVGGLGDCIFFLNSLSVLWDAQRRSWGDHAAGTAVVVDETGERRSAWTPPAVAAALCAALSFGLVLLSGTGPSLKQVADDATTPSGTTYQAPTDTGSTGSSQQSGSSGTSTSGGTSTSAGTSTSGGTDAGTSQYDANNYGQQPVGSGSSSSGYSGSGSSGSSSTSSGSSLTFTAKENLVIRTGPTRSYPEIETIAAGDSVTIDCQTEGEQVTGDHGASDLWDHIVSPVNGYVSDEYVYTGTTGTDARVAGLC